MKLLNNYWYIILEASELKPAKPLKLKRFGKELVLWRSGNQLACVDDRCPHRGASLSLGQVKDGCISCPFHGIRFDEKGQCSKIPFVDEDSVRQTLSVNAYRVIEHGGFIWLWHGDDYQGQVPRLFSNMEAGYPYHSMSVNWQAHYSRVIENQLDYYHLPFVHRSSIGRGFKPATSRQLQERLRVSFEDDVISCRMQTADRPWASKFRFMFANAWQLQLAPFAFLFVAFCPVDDHNTVLIVRSYVKTPYLKSFTALLLKSSPLFNWRILAEDESVVVSQSPKIVQPDMDEHLLALDKPIAVFRKHYFERLQA